ncbi:MAG: polysaccharide biosynthesis/export family protein [Chitinophagaceae bacterium]|jgi:polysaccharide export outer membrane protein|nr:polysaccharide biosynthesis/export family protein [Chitinophagaceae bacterium]
MLPKIISKLLPFTVLVALVTSCTNINKLRQSYEMFQTGFDTTTKSFQFKDLTLKVGDNINVMVGTLATASQEQIAVYKIGTKDGTYTVNNQGEINFPRLGAIKVVGLTCLQVRDTLKAEWGKYVKDIFIDVQLNGFTVNVFGQVTSGGAKFFKTERATVLDAIAVSNGLLLDGKRQNVMVIREDSGKRVNYFIDLRDAKMYESPAFQLQQNDIVYINADDQFYRSMAGRNMRDVIQPFTQTAGFALSIINTIVILFAINR